MSRLVINDQRSFVLRLLHDVFQRESQVTISEQNSGLFSSRGDLDAVIVPGWFAHSRYGGTPQPWKSQVIKPQNEVSAPPWVVTTPHFPAHLLFDETENAQVVRDDPGLPPADEVRTIFLRAFQAIKRFNKETGTLRIETLGVDLIFLGIPTPDCPEEERRKEIEAIHRVYVEEWKPSNP